MEKRRIVSLALAGMLALGTLTACGEKENNTGAEVSFNPEAVEEVRDMESTEPSVETQNPATTWDNLEYYLEEPESRIYNPYEHLFFVRVNNIGTTFVGANSRSVTGGSIEIPEGYEVVEINNFEGLGGKIGTTQTYGFDIWYINTVPVLVEPTFNEGSKCYDYSCPGTVIELDQTIESEKILTK